MMNALALLFLLCDECDDILDSDESDEESDNELCSSCKKRKLQSNFDIMQLPSKA